MFPMNRMQPMNTGMGAPQRMQPAPQQNRMQIAQMMQRTRQQPQPVRPMGMRAM
jgi:hypothetical protein